MISLQDLQSKLIRIKDQLDQKVSYPYLMDHITLPDIDEDKLLLLVSIMDQLNLSYRKIENYAIAAMLIQLALDTHELIQNASITEDDQINFRKRQLTILAADYYSGLYYQLLAEANDVHMIRILAEGIKDVNEHKISLYKENLEGTDNLFYSVKMVEYSIFERMTDYFQSPSWNDLISNFLLVKRLVNEKNSFLQDGTSVVFDALKKLIFKNSNQRLGELTLEQKKYLINVCDRYIDYSKHLIETSVSKLPSLNNLLHERIQKLLSKQPLAKTCVEEG